LGAATGGGEDAGDAARDGCWTVVESLIDLAFRAAAADFSSVTSDAGIPWTKQCFLRSLQKQNQTQKIQRFYLQV
jgi:hypothetical protein